MCILLKYKISCFLLQLRPFSRATRALHFCMPTKRGNWRSLPNINYLKPEFQKHARFSKNGVYSLL